MGDVLFVWTGAYQTCLRRARVLRLLSSLYQCLVKRVLIVLQLTSTLACLVTKQCLVVFGRQTFPVYSGPNKCKLLGNHFSPVVHFNWRYSVPRPLYNNLLLNYRYQQKTSWTYWTFALHRPTFSTTVNRAKNSCMEQPLGRLSLLSPRRIVMQHLDKSALATCRQTIPLWLRYVDDTFTAVHKRRNNGL